MSSNQDRNNVSYRPMWWIYGTGIVLFVIGEFIVSLNLSSSATPSWWSKVGPLFVVLSMFSFLTIPGALLGFRHPWGAAFRLQAEEGRYAHPRLLGLARVWAGLVVSGSMSANLFVPLSTSIANWVLAMCLIALAPFVTLYLFDRRR